MALLIIVLGLYTAHAANTNVHGYNRKDGTYVPGHVRSNPDRSKSNNLNNSKNNDYNIYTGNQNDRALDNDKDEK